MAVSSPCTLLRLFTLNTDDHVYIVSTALALSHRHPNTNITLVEASRSIPNPHGSSVDASRIIRADYANQAYAKLAAQAIDRWRNDDWGRDGRYMESGLLLVYPNGSSNASTYAMKSYENVKPIEGDRVVYLPTRADVQAAAPAYREKDLVNIAGGYVNWGSGWSHAEDSVRYIKQRLDREGKVKFRTGLAVDKVLFDNNAAAKGVLLTDGTSISTDLIILATGAWSPQIIDLRGRAISTGQAVAFMPISDEELAVLSRMPTILNFANGIFIIPPRDNRLKIARHGYGYHNPKSVSVPGASEMMSVSLPEPGVPIPLEGELAFRSALKELLPSLADRPFIETRVCWYTDTYVILLLLFLLLYHTNRLSSFIVQMATL